MKYEETFDRIENYIDETLGFTLDGGHEPFFGFEGDVDYEERTYDFSHKGIANVNNIQLLDSYLLNETLIENIIDYSIDLEKFKLSITVEQI